MASWTNLVAPLPLSPSLAPSLSLFLSMSLCHSPTLRPLQLIAERRNIFSWRREQCSTTHKRLVLIKLPLIPLSVLALPSPPLGSPPPLRHPPHPHRGTRRGAGFSRMGQKSEFNGPLCGEEEHEIGYSVERRKILLCSTAEARERKKEREEEKKERKER